MEEIFLHRPVLAFCGFLKAFGSKFDIKKSVRMSKRLWRLDIYKSVR